MRSSVLSTVLLSLSTRFLCIDAFRMPATRSFERQSSISYKTALQGMLPLGDDFTDEESSFDVEAARKRLESLVDSDGNTIQGASSQKEHSSPWKYERSNPLRLPISSIPNAPVQVELPPPPPLTAMERERREAEIQFLEQLEKGDDSVSNLWTLWYQERGVKAAAQLGEAEVLTGNPRGWIKAEAILRELISEYGVYWTEPVNRLATLYYIQGRLEEAEVLCKIVLQLKPWHFGALSGIVMIYADLHDSDAARIWAARRLPAFAPTGTNRRREAWVGKALFDAEQSLVKAEARVSEAFGAPDDHATTRGRRQLRDQKNHLNLFDDDAWQ
jgi:hypothetical protein